MEKNKTSIGKKVRFFSIDITRKDTAISKLEMKEVDSAKVDYKLPYEKDYIEFTPLSTRNAFLNDLQKSHIKISNIKGYLFKGILKKELLIDTRGLVNLMSKYNGNTIFGTKSFKTDLAENNIDYCLDDNIDFYT